MSSRPWNRELWVDETMDGFLPFFEIFWDRTWVQMHRHNNVPIDGHVNPHQIPFHVIHGTTYLRDVWDRFAGSNARPRMSRVRTFQEVWDAIRLESDEWADIMIPQDDEELDLFTREFMIQLIISRQRRHGLR